MWLDGFLLVKVKTEDFDENQNSDHMQQHTSPRQAARFVKVYHLDLGILQKEIQGKKTQEILQYQLQCFKCVMGNSVNHQSN